MMFHILLAFSLLARRVIAVPAPQMDGEISWGSCRSFGVDSTDTNLQCGYLEVPMDYHDTSPGSARLAVAKYATTASKRLGTIFFNPGGRGNSGVEAIAELGPSLSQSFQGLYDIVSWDLRGVGHTTPGAVYCFTTAEENGEFWTNTVVSYINESIIGKFDQQDLRELYSQADPTEKKFKTFTAGCQNGASGPYLKYLGTSSTVRDLVSLGDAIVGPGQPIDYWGISYGSVIGFNLINMFPEVRRALINFVEHNVEHVQRVGHMTLDGVVDPDTWASYKFLRSSLQDTEGTFSALTDGCAKAGRDSCKLIEIIGNNATGDDVKTLVNYAHDVALELYRRGYGVPAVPGFVKAWLLNLLETPTTWSQDVNTYLYGFVALVLQASQTYNITTQGGRKYNIPFGNIIFNGTGGGSTPTLMSYTQMAIIGADNFNDSVAMTKDVFDTIVNNTREVTPSFGTVWSSSYNPYVWPAHSVERLPPYTGAAKLLNTPVLVIGNTIDPVTPLAGAQKTADMLGDNAFLVEQLGVGHTSFAQSSPCTFGIITGYFINSTLPQKRRIQCPVDNHNFFVLNGAVATPSWGTYKITPNGPGYFPHCSIPSSCGGTARFNGCCIMMKRG